MTIVSWKFYDRYEFCFCPEGVTGCKWGMVFRRDSIRVTFGCKGSKVFELRLRQNVSESYN